MPVIHTNYRDRRVTASGPHGGGHHLWSVVQRDTHRVIQWGQTETASDALAAAMTAAPAVK